MQDNLPLACANPNKRPRVPTDEMRRRVALQIAARLKDCGPPDEVAADIIRVTRHGWHQDGYQLARDLDRTCSWECDLGVAEELDNFSGLCDLELDVAVRQWAVENPMEPPFPIGSLVKTPSQGVGTIVGVCQYSPASYRVRTPGLNEKSAWIIPFEDVSAA
jgi:hypothetical protein